MREETLVRSRDRNRLAASKILLLHSGAGDRRGFFVVLPIFKPLLPHGTAEERRRNLAGFVQGVFQTDMMFETVLSGIKVPLDIHIFAPDAGPDALPIYFLPSKFRTAPVKPSSWAALQTGGPQWSGELAVVDLNWELIATPFVDGSTTSHATAWILLFSGLALSAVATAFMSSSSRYAARLVRANQTVMELSRTDALTSLANRRAFLDELASAFAARNDGPPFAVLVVDLDNFKHLNDTLGHLVGDALLKEVAERLEKIVSPSDLVSRFGGDEFAILRDRTTDISATRSLAQDAVEKLAIPYVIEGNTLFMSVSIGISIYSARLSEPKEIMIQADVALCRAKADGRNRYCFYGEDLDETVRERVALADEVRIALDRGEFQLYYQPQVELASGRIVGLEALARWNHPRRGFVMPSLFIPIAEQTGTIVRLGRWAFDESCRQLRSWQDEGIAPELVAVNCSAVQFKGQSGLESDILQSLARWGIAPGAMEIELTETVLMEVTQQHCDLLNRLRDLGLRIALDDFGTGYSSLIYLTTYPITRLKIAQQLVGRVDSDPRNATVVRAAIQLAQELGIEFIAEGVETEAQLEFLTSAGCRLGQGYYFSRPVSAEHATELLRRGRFEIAEPQARSHEVVGTGT
jgi:diguanylate cyclase (GGDEF)-like protein